MNCQQIKSQLEDYQDGTLAAAERTHFEQHIAQCADCRATAKEAKALRDALGAMPVAEPTPDFFDRALAIATAERVLEAPTQNASKWYTSAIGGAIAAGIVALTIGMLFISQPELESPANANVPKVAMTVEETRTINLVFASETALEQVSLTVDLPLGVELANHPGSQQVRWTTQMQAGKNVLPLQLIAVDGMGGELVATLRRADNEKVFTVNIEVVPG